MLTATERSAISTDPTQSISAEVFKRKQAKIEDELAAAKQSRAETEGQLRLEQDDLIMALELAGDVAKVYAEADERTRRGYNQAFFKHIWISAMGRRGGMHAR